MGTGESGAYYTSGGSALIHHETIIHSIEGKFTHDPRTGMVNRIASGGHGQASIDLLVKFGFNFRVVKTYPNGVRLGYIQQHKEKLKRTGDNQAWFPSSWTPKTIIQAGEHVASLKHNQNQPEGTNLWGTFHGVRVGIKKRGGKIITIFPSHDQPE